MNTARWIVAGIFGLILACILIHEYYIMKKNMDEVSRLFDRRDDEPP